MRVVVCDKCYREGKFDFKTTLHECGELGDFCGKHFQELKDFVNGEKDAVVMEGVTEDDVAVNVTFTPEKKRSKKNSLPW